MVGKTGPIFPMIGKIFRPFSNDWKKFSEAPKCPKAPRFADGPWEERTHAAPRRRGGLGGEAPCGRTFRFFGNDSGRGGWPRDCGEIFGEWSVRAHSPPSERGVPPEGRWLMDASAERKEKAAGGVLRVAVDTGFRMVHPQGDCFVCWRWKVVIAATADRSTPPVAAPAAWLLPFIRLPCMAAPPPSRRGAGPVALLATCMRGVPRVVPLNSPEHQKAVQGCPRLFPKSGMDGWVGRRLMAGRRGWRRRRRGFWRGL